jgi:predicted flap endonuclease-1-like 5' DNA nuclease
MPYTLTAGLLWYSGALGVGLVLGWLLRSTSALRQVSRARRQERSSVQQELDDLRSRVGSEEELRLERNRLRHDNDLLREQLASRPVETGEAPAEHNDAVEQVESPTPDLEEGARVLGRRLSSDDLQVINGIGPVIEGLLNGVGIRSWSDLAAADIDTLTSTLADAGSRFARYNPASWPEQARALMAGDWAQFESLG